VELVNERNLKEKLKMVRAVYYAADVHGLIRFNDKPNNIHLILAQLTLLELLGCSDSLWLIPGMEG
jgi:hypothetical protein